MAMIGRNSAVAEMGKHRHELKGAVAFAAWLGVHAALLSSTQAKVEAFVEVLGTILVPLAGTPFWTALTKLLHRKLRLALIRQTCDEH
jgi:hypothetical protein